MQHSTNYVVMFIVGLTAVAALILALLFTGFKPMHERNEALFNKRAILSAIETKLDTKVEDMTDEDVENIFATRIEQIALDMEGNLVDSTEIKARGYKGGQAEHIDMKKEKKKDEADRILPLFAYESSGDKYYIVSVRGNGLWDEIWGNIALEENFDRIIGATFDHQGETPGLGAEIKDNPGFSAQFVGKEIYDEDEYVSVTVRKGGAKSELHDVDGISGATVTADGVTEMLWRGIKYYEPYFNKTESN